MLVNYYYYLCLSCIRPFTLKDTGAEEDLSMILIVFLCVFCVLMLKNDKFLSFVGIGSPLTRIWTLPDFDLPLNAFMCATAILNIVSLSGLRASALQVGTISDNSVM